MNLLHQNLEQAAERAPDKVALRCADHAMTYAELDRASSQLANLLIRSGVKPADTIGIRLTLSTASVVAVYGVLKAGAIYLPIDSDLPVQQTCEILRANDVRTLITFNLNKLTSDQIATQAPLVSTLVGPEKHDPEEHDPEEHADSLRVIPWSTIETSPTCPSVARLPSDSAYIISTSGSTGDPKGILHTHSSGQRYAELTVDEYALNTDDVIASPSPLHFDMSTFGIFAGILAGATVVIVPPAYARLSASLSTLIERERITIWYSVPFALMQLLERGNLQDRDCESLRWVVFAGEGFPTKPLNRLRKTWPFAAFSNAYGPAETNVCTVYNIPPINGQLQPKMFETNVPIGKPWGDNRAFVLAKDGHPTPPGECGELVIHTQTMMNRYVNGQTDDENTFWIDHISGDRFYRTGDFVRVNQFGEYNFQGRIDRQTKVRGHRIELDAIETAILRHPSVQECSVTSVKTDESAELSATLTIIQNATHEISSGDIQRWLSQKLPAYCIPPTVRIADHLPRTSTGKIDRMLVARHPSPTNPKGVFTQ
ncbi:MAG: amino acid adenylation domain-containing protein [Fuerstiella sp.]